MFSVGTAAQSLIGQKLLMSLEGPAGEKKLLLLATYMANLKPILAKLQVRDEQ